MQPDIGDLIEIDLGYFINENEKLLGIINELPCSDVQGLASSLFLVEVFTRPDQCYRVYVERCEFGIIIKRFGLLVGVV